LSSAVLQLPAITQVDISKAINPLSAPQSVSFDDTPCTVINGCPTKLLPLLKYISYLSLSLEHFQTQLTKADFVLFGKKTTVLLLVIMKQIPF
jgi:hypothetical protein